jgi:hypothetical protein
MLPSVAMTRVKHPTLPLIFARGIELPFFFSSFPLHDTNRVVRLHGSLTTNRISLVGRHLSLDAPELKVGKIRDSRG